MKLKVIKRSSEKKSDAKKIRRDGGIPAVMYAKDKEAENIVIDKNEFEAILRNIKQGRLSTTKLELVNDEGKKNQAILKDIQYDKTTYNIIHLDFEALEEDVQVNVKVPIECIGMAECEGIKLGGVLRQVIRTLKVRCLPKDIPDVFILDVQDLKVRDSKRLMDINIPKSVRALANLNEVVAAIVKR